MSQVIVFLGLRLRVNEKCNLSISIIQLSKMQTIFLSSFAPNTLVKISRSRNRLCPMFTMVNEHEHEHEPIIENDSIRYVKLNDNT